MILMEFLVTVELAIILASLLLESILEDVACILTSCGFFISSLTAVFFVSLGLSANLELLLLRSFLLSSPLILLVLPDLMQFLALEWLRL